MTNIDIDNLIQNWREKTIDLERSIFDVLIGNYIKHEDDRSTTIYFVCAVNRDGIHTITIERDDSFLTFGTVIIELETLSEYQMVHISLMLSKFSTRILIFFEKLVEADREQMLEKQEAFNKTLKNQPE